MKRIIFALCFSSLFANTLRANPDQLKIGAGFGLFGFHGYGNPTLNLSYGNALLRLRPGYNSLGLGLELELSKQQGFGMLTGENQMGAFLISISTIYQNKPPQILFRALDSEIETIKPWSYFVMIGSKTYHSERMASGIKFGAVAGEREWQYNDPFYGEVLRSQKFLLPYLELSIYVNLSKIN